MSNDSSYQSKIECPINLDIECLGGCENCNYHKFFKDQDNDSSCQTIIACKNCIHFDWSIQLCHLWAMYYNDDDRCASFVSVYDVYDTSHTKVKQEVE